MSGDIMSCIVKVKNEALERGEGIGSDYSELCLEVKHHKSTPYILKWYVLHIYAHFLRHFLH